MNVKKEGALQFSFVKSDALLSAEEKTWSLCTAIMVLTLAHTVLMLGVNLYRIPAFNSHFWRRV